ncbi:MAG: ammonium transporter [Phycisphaerales bacterium]|nr:ammonium transporter [Phycisphaerales bacterium]
MARFELRRRLGGKLSYREKFSRMGERLKDPDWRKYFYTIAAGKALGIALVMAVILAIAVLPAMLSAPAHAQDAATGPAATQPTTQTAAVAPPDAYAAIKPVDHINAMNTLWVLLGAFLVFGMQAGFTMLEAGFCRSRETVNVLVECVFDTCVCGLLHWAFGFAFMFGEGNPFIGWHIPGEPDKSLIFMSGVSVLSTYASTGIPIVAHYVFQFAFADCASTICSGAMVGRTRFIGDVLYSIGVSGVIYPVFGHWCWGPDGFLATMGSDGHFLSALHMNFHDFAGSTVVHSIGGWVAIAGAIMLGPRVGRKFKRDGGGPMLPHDLTIAVVGGLILWFGWYGFNPCSTLSIMDNAGAGRVAMNTTLAACTGGLAAEFVMFMLVKKWDTAAIVNGFLAGLVAITCPCYWVSGIGASALGAVAGVLVILAMELLEYLRIDDPVGAWPVHGVCGIWGTLSLGLFASGEYSAAGSSPFGVPSVIAKSPDALTGLFYGGGAKVLIAQCVGSAIVCAATFASAMAMFGVLKAVRLLRVSKEGELQGLDIDQHGISAYPEYVISALAAPQGTPADTVAYHPKSDRFAELVK